MKTNSYIIFVFFVFLVSCEKDDDFGASPHEISDDNNSTSLQVEIHDLDNTDGNLAIAVFNNSSDFDSGLEAYIDSVIPISSVDLIINFNDIVPGTYAVSVFHDEDQSGDITFGGFLNLIPQEGFGFSNNPNIGMSQPSYNDCSFDIQDSQTLLVPIDIVYF